MGRIDFQPALDADYGSVWTACALCGNPAVRPVDVELGDEERFVNGPVAALTFECETGCRYRVDFGFHKGGCFIRCKALPSHLLRQERRVRTAR